MLSRKTGKKLNTYVPDYVVFDLETTGVSCNSDDVVEISAVKVINGEIVDE
ncbi:MAG: DNA polymerase III subunit epsilon, partial [Lachnospiraceae bacterium]|nr:DNA polymerase III subunit epsilon [Lachnospiraceae bacterium]